ncbi:MAG: hypothetical protein IIA45_13445 [Bacteroidetes bacterium]|nr:hypothetical protein [Bacteroidota bacterium]
MKLFQDIVNDRESGSAALLLDILEVLKVQINADQKELIPIIEYLFKNLHQFTIISSFLNEFMIRLETGELSDLKKDAKSYLENYQQKLIRSNEKISEIFLNYLTDFNFKTNPNPNPVSVLTHSQSSTVFHVIEQIMREGHEIVVFQTESIPGNEGQIQSDKLNVLKINTLLIKDQEITAYLDKVDLVLLGVDQLHSDRFLNKVGSKEIALEARERHIPVIVVGDSRKLIVQGDTKTDFHDNSIFEWIPNQLITAFILDTGLFNPQQMLNLSSGIQYSKKLSKLLK